MSYRCVTHCGILFAAKWLALTILTISFCAAGPIAIAESPILAIEAIYPPILAAGSSSTVKVVSGRFTQDIDELVFSRPGIRATLDTAPNLPFDNVPQKQYGSFQVQVDADVPDGIYEVWAVGRYGISNPRSIAIVHSPVEAFPTEGDAKQVPQLKSGTWYVGHMRPNGQVSFRVDTQNPHPKVVVVAESIDSLALPVITAKDPLGGTLLQKRASGSQPLTVDSNDYRTSNSNDELFFTLHDFLYRGGDSFAFALRIDHDATQIPQLLSLRKQVESIALQGLVEWPRVEAIAPYPTCAAPMPSPPWVTELEMRAGQNKLSLEFSPVEGHAYECEVFSHSLDQPSDLRVIVERIPVSPDPQKLLPAELLLVGEDGPVTGSRAVRLASTDPLVLIPAGGASLPVRITLVDLLRSPSTRSSSRAIVRVGPAVPRFHALAHWTPDTNNSAQAKITGAYLPKGGQASLHVSLRRAGGFGGNVRILVNGLPAGVTASPAVIAENQTETEIVLYADETAAAWTGPVLPVAVATIDGKEVASPVHAATIATSASADRGVPQSRLTSQLLLRIIEQDVAPIQIRAGEGKVIEVAQGATIPIPVRAVRRSGGEAKSILRPQNLPPKVTFGEFELAPGVNEANPEWKVAADAPLGEYCVWFQAEMVIKKPLHPESLARSVAYRDRLQSLLADPSWNGDRPALEKAIADTNTKIEALTKETTPRDFPTFFSTASFCVRIVPPQPAP